MIATPQSKIYSAEEYLALEVESYTRSVYRNVEIVPFTGGTPALNALTNALSSMLWYDLMKSPYQVYVTDQRVQIPVTNLYTYPDVMVVPEPIELLEGRKDTIINPVLIAEVLSDSTKNYDRGDKFQAYCTTPSFQEYLLIDQYRRHMEHRIKQAENQWLLTTYDSRSSKISLNAVPTTINIDMLYSKVRF